MRVEVTTVKVNTCTEKTVKTRKLNHFPPN
jgi:hypothetical protein